MTLREVFESQDFIQFRGEVLSENDKRHFLEQLSKGRKLYNVIPLLQVMETLPSDLLRPIIEEVLNYKDISEPKKYMESILRIFTPEKVQELVLGIMIDSKNLKTKCKTAGILYCIHGRFIIYKFSKNEKFEDAVPFGARYIWNGRRYNHEISKENIEPFRKREKDFKKQRFETLINEFNKNDNIIYKYYLRWYLPNESEKYPLFLQEKAQKIIKEITSKKFPQSATSLIELVDGDEDLEFLLFNELNWQKKRSSK